MKKTLKSLLLLAFFSCLVLTVKAQSSIVLKDSTILVKVKIKDATPFDKQYEIRFTDKDKKEYHLTPNDIILFREKKKMYVSKPLTLNGITQQLFLERIMYNDSISLYVYRTEEEKDLIVYERKGEKLIPLTETNNPFIEYLKTFPIITQNPELEEDIENTPFTANHLIEKYNIVKKNNINLFTRFRWGGMVSGGFSQINQANNLSFSKESHLMVGLFADLPIYKYFSFHPEVFYIKNAKLNEQKSDIQLAFNREAIILPLLFRFSYNDFRGRIIPFLQLGPEVFFTFKGESNWDMAINNVENYTEIISQPDFKHPNVSFAGSIGIGVEYKLNKKHSVFIDIRYRHEPNLKLLEKYKTSISYLSTTLSYNL